MPKMTYAEMSAFLDDFFDRLRRVRDAGQREYAQDDDNVFANFDRIAERLGSTREEVMLTYALKHVDGITAHVRGLQSQREGVLGRVEDLIMYLLLFAASETKAEAEAEAFFAEESLNRLFSSSNAPSDADEAYQTSIPDVFDDAERYLSLYTVRAPSEADLRRWAEAEKVTMDAALAAGNAPRSPEKASGAVYGALDAAGVHDAFEAARERRAARRARVDAKRAKTQQQQKTSDGDGADGGGQQLQQHSPSESAPEAACVCVFDAGWRYDDNDCPRHGLPNQPTTGASSFKGFSEAAEIDGVCDLGDDCPICNPWEDVDPPSDVKVDEDAPNVYCGICEDFHSPACDELHASWSPAPRGDARDARP